MSIKSYFHVFQWYKQRLSRPLFYISILFKENKGKWLGKLTNVILFLYSYYLIWHYTLFLIFNLKNRIIFIFYCLISYLTYLTVLLSYLRLQKSSGIIVASRMYDFTTARFCNSGLVNEGWSRIFELDNNYTPYAATLARASNLSPG